MTLVNLIGRVMQFDSKESENGVKYTDLRLQVRRPYKNYDGNYDNDYFRIALFDSYHNRAQQYFTKGMGIAIKGRLETSKWTDENNQSRYNVVIVTESLMFLPKSYELETADFSEELSSE